MTTPNQAPRPRLNLNIYILTLTSLLTDVSSEMLNNLIPLFLVNVLKASTAAVGLIDGVAETTASLVKIFSGRISDRMGQRKPLTVMGYSLSTLAKPFLFFATTWEWVLGVRFADRVGKGIRTAPRDALLAGSATPEQRGLAFGIHRAGDTLGAFLGLGIATIIIWLRESRSTELTRQTFQIIVLASIIPAVLAVLILALGVKEVEKKPAAAATGASPTAALGFKNLDLRFRKFLVVMVLFTLGNSSDSFIILRGQNLGLSLLHIMGMLLTFNAVFSILAGPLGSLSDRIGRRRLILIGWILYGLVYLGLALSKTGWQVWMLYGIYGIFYALTDGIGKALVADLVPQEQRGTAYGWFNAAIGITALPASVIAGVLWQGLGSWTGFGAASPFFFGAGLALLAGFLLRFWAI